MPPLFPPPGQMPPYSPASSQAPTTPSPGAWPAAPARQRKSRLGLFLGGGVAAVIVLYLVIAAVASTFPFAKPKPTPTSTPTLQPTVTTSLKATSSASSSASASASASSSSASPTASGSLAALPAGVKALKVLLPTDIQDAGTECAEQTKIPWTNPGLVTADSCTAPDMPNGQIFGYQMDSAADYKQAWANYNTWSDFGTSNTVACPPGSGQSQGGPGEWWGPRFPKMSGQVLECFTSSSGPVYVWTYPTENAFVVAQPPKSWTFSKLETWWEDNSV
jgi:hypothetical protein